MELESSIGSNLIKADGTEIKSKELSTNTGAVLGLYFSAHWCPPCRKFTPKLAKVYENLKKSSQDFEVIFISSDSSEDEFKSYFKEMPWLAIPFDDKSMKDSCFEKYKVDGYPTLVLINAESGEVISNDGTTLIEECGAEGFPFSEKRIEECKKEKKLNKTKICKLL